MRFMPVAGIIHWKPAESTALVEICRKAGLEVRLLQGDGLAVVRAVRSAPPDVLVFDLSRLPSHSKSVASYLRQSKVTRCIPVVFSGGLPEKIDNVRKELPDAVYCDLTKTGVTAKRAARAGAMKDAVVPAGPLERYKERTTAQKLGIASGSSVRVVEPPREFPDLLGTLPASVDFTEDVAPLTLWFVHSYDQLLASLRAMRSAALRTKLWIVWRKGTGREVTQNVVRESLNEVGLVDYKICSVNQQWSGMLFARKKG